MTWPNAVPAQASKGLYQASPFPYTQCENLIKMGAIFMFRFRELGFYIVSACEIKADLPLTGEGTLVRKLCLSVLPNNHLSKGTMRAGKMAHGAPPEHR